MKNINKILFTGTLSIFLIILSSMTVIATESADSIENGNYYYILLSNKFEISGQIISQDVYHITIKNNNKNYKIPRKDILNFKICDECKRLLLNNFKQNNEVKSPSYTFNVSAGIVNKLIIGFWGPNKTVLGYEIGGGIAFYPTNYFSPRINFSYKRFRDSESSFDSFEETQNYYCLNADLLLGKINPKNPFIYYGLIKLEYENVNTNYSYQYNSSYYTRTYTEDYNNNFVSLGLGGGLGNKVSKRISLYIEGSAYLLSISFSKYENGLSSNNIMFSLKAGINYSF